MKTRRDFIKTTQAATLGTAILPQFAFNILSNSSTKEEVIGHGKYQYRVHKNWVKTEVTKAPIENCHEMVLDSQGRLIMVTDETQNNILIFDKAGKLLDSWGTGYPGGHGLTLSKEGEDDFLFIVDCGWYQDKNQKWQKQAGRIEKTDLTGRLIFSIGHPQSIGIYEEGQSFMPTEVAVSPNGDFYVADGYGSDYIIQYNHQGEYIRHFGGHKNENKDHNLKNAHGVCVDSRDPDNPVLICTSRQENCFKVFTLEGKYLYTIPLPGAFVCRPVIDSKNIYAGVCWSKVDGKLANNTGFVTILNKDNQVVSNPGGTKPTYKNDSLQAMRNEGDVFFHCHDVCVDEDKNLYICQWNAERTFPVKLERV